MLLFIHNRILFGIEIFRLLGIKEGLDLFRQLHRAINITSSMKLAHD